MIDVLINDAFLLAIWHFDLVLYNLDGAIGTSGLAYPATGTAVFVIPVVRHHHFALEPVIHF